MSSNPEYNTNVECFETSTSVTFSDIPSLRRALENSTLRIPRYLDIIFLYDETKYFCNEEGEDELLEMFQVSSYLNDTVQMLFQARIDLNSVPVTPDTPQKIWISNFSDLQEKLLPLSPYKESSICVCDEEIGNSMDLELVFGDALSSGKPLVVSVENAEPDWADGLSSSSDVKSREDTPFQVIGLIPESSDSDEGQVEVLKLYEPFDSSDRIVLEFGELSDEEIAEKNAFTEDDIRRQAEVVAQTPAGSAFICENLRRMKTSAIRTLSQRISKDLLRVGSNPFGAKVIDALLRNDRFTKALYDTIRKHCRMLVVSEPGAAVLQSVLEVGTPQCQERLMTSLLQRSKKDMLPHNLAAMARLEFGGRLLTGNLSRVAHEFGHAMICLSLSQLGRKELFDLSVDPFGYLFVQSVVAAYCSEEQNKLSDSSHERIWQELTNLTSQLAENERGCYVLACMLQHAPETYRNEMEESLLDKCDDILAIIDKENAPTNRDGTVHVTGETMSIRG